MKNWSGGKIEIELQDGKYHYQAGEVIRGNIIVTQTAVFNGSELRVGLHGAEYTFFKSLHSDEDFSFTGRYNFMNVDISVEKYQENKSPVGRQQFPFEFKTPEWVPQSTIYSTDNMLSNLKIAYAVFAQIVPISRKDYVDRMKTISIFRGTADIHLYRAPIKIPICDNLKSKVETKVGGLMGFGGSTCITEVIFDRNQYYVGDKCSVKIVCDNSKCSTAIKSFKIKLKRKVFARGERMTAFGENQIQNIKTSKYLYQFKDVNHGCGPKMKVERVISFDIPIEDPDTPGKDLKQIKYSDLDQALVRGLTGSVNGQTYTILYSLKVFVKHDSLTSLGEGDCVTLPIRILERPKEEDAVRVDLTDSLMNIKVSMASTDSDGKSQLQDLKLAQNTQLNCYIEKYVKNWELSWIKAAPPTVLTEKELKEEEKEIEESQNAIERETMIRKTKVVVETSNEPIYGQNFSEIPTNELDGNSSSDSEEEKKEEQEFVQTVGEEQIKEELLNESTIEIIETKRKNLDQEWHDLVQNPISGVSMLKSDQGQVDTHEIGWMRVSELQLKRQSTISQIVPATHWWISLKPTQDSIYAEGVFKIMITFEIDYPKIAPSVKFLTKIYHPQVSNDGSARLPIQINWSETTAKEQLTARNLLQQLVQQLVEISEDEHLQPGIAFEFKNDNDYFKEIAKQWVIQYALSEEASQ